MTKEEVKIGMMVIFEPDPNNEYFSNAIKNNEFEADDPIVGYSYIVRNTHECSCGTIAISIGIRYLSYNSDSGDWTPVEEISCLNGVIGGNDSNCPKQLPCNGEMFNISHFRAGGRSPLNIKIKI